jgi:hypothetical protein
MGAILRQLLTEAHVGMLAEVVMCTLCHSAEVRILEAAIGQPPARCFWGILNHKGNHVTWT